MLRFYQHTLIVLGLISILSSSGQSYSNVAEDYNISVYVQGAWVGAGVSFYDFNDDGWDDLTFCLKGSPVKFYQNFEGTLIQIDSFVANVGEAKQPLWGDYDNDGDADLLVTRYEATTLLYENTGNFNFMEVSASAGLVLDPAMKSYGAAWGDYDRDGWLDLYVCNYNFNGTISNLLYRNLGNGTFEEVSASLGVGNGQNPSFQPAFIDYNNDLWPDIYIINDKVPENVLWRNAGDGSFEDVSGTTGANLIMDAMSNSWSDFDHDGDLDVYITNGTAGNKFLINESGEHFTESAADLGLAVYSICWGAQWVDFNNDGWDDLYVLATDNGLVGPQNYFFQNNEGILEANNEAGLTSDLVSSYSNCLGDFNNDGYPDIAVSNEYPSNASLWLNSGGNNNFIKLTLEGVVSNRDGIGTWIEYFVAGQKRVKYTQSGGNYMGQNSQHIILGLGESMQVDSINLLWPSGVVDHYTGLPANVNYNFEEGQSAIPEITSSASGLCPGGTLELDAGDHDSWLWSTGDTTQSIIISVPGEYWVSVSDYPGIFVDNFIEISEFDSVLPILEFDNINCFGEVADFALVANAEMFLAINWSTGATGSSIENLFAGNYEVLLTDSNLCEQTQTFSIIEPAELIVVLETPATYPGELSSLIEGGTSPYSYLWSNGSTDPNILVSEEGVYSLWVIDSLGCTSFASVSVVIPGTSVLARRDVVVLQENSSLVIAGPLDMSGAVSIFDNTGRLVKGVQYHGGELKIQLPDTDNCLIVRILTDDGGMHTLLAYPNP